MEAFEQNEEYQEIDLLELLGHLIEKWWLIVLTTLLAGGLAYYIAAEKITPTYTAQSTIFIGQDSSSAMKISMDQLNLDNKLIIDYKELVNTRLISERVVKELALTTNAAQLSKFLQVNTINNSRFMHITFTDADADLAAKIVNKYSDVLKENAESVVGVKNIKIVDYAATPQAPSGPQVLQNTAIAAVLGGLAAIAIILLNVLLNNTVRKEEEIDRELGLTVLGVIPKFKGESK